MKKKVMLIVMSILVVMLTFVFVGCNKDKTDEEPTTTEKFSTTESTTFVAPEIEDEPTTEPTTEEQITKEVETTKKTVSTNSGSSSGSSGSSGSSNKKPVSTTKAQSSSSSSDSNAFNSAGKDENGNEVYVNENGFKITIDDGKNGASYDVGDIEYTTDEGADKAKLE